MVWKKKKVKKEKLLFITLLVKKYIVIITWKETLAGQKIKLPNKEQACKQPQCMPYYAFPHLFILVFCFHGCMCF